MIDPITKHGEYGRVMMEAIFSFFLGFSGWKAYLAVFIALMACGLGLPLPEDVTLFGAGLLAYHGKADVHGMVALSMFAVILGDSFIFWIGARWGSRIRHWGPFRTLLTEERYQFAKQRLQEKGNRVIFSGRFMPGLRAPIFFTAGTLQLPYSVFIFYDGLAAIISVPLIVYSIWYFGDQVDRVIEIIQNVEYGIAAVIVSIVIFIAIKFYWNKAKLKRNLVEKV